MQNTTKRLFLGFSVKKTLECQFFYMQQKLTLYINTEALAVLQSNMHITLGFLGQVKPSCIPALLTEVDSLEKPSFELVLSAISCWQKPQIICLQGQANASLLAMASDVAQIAAKFDLYQHSYSYCPHTTLFRQATNLALPQHPIKGLHDKLPIHVSVSQLHLYESCNTTSGVQYDILHSWRLEQDQQTQK